MSTLVKRISIPLGYDGGVYIHAQSNVHVHTPKQAKGTIVNLTLTCAILLL